MVLITASGWLLTAQCAVFAIGALAGLKYAPYGLVFRHLVRPRLTPPQELENEAPPRFAQAVGMAFTLVGAVGYLTGLTWLGTAATALALAAAFLNSAFDYCLGCEVYVLFHRSVRRRRPAAEVAGS